jgi:hypothetical protein
MILSHCSHEPVLHVVKNMRERDREEIYNLRWDDNPFTILNDVMARKNFAWVAWLDERPAAVFGGAPLHPGVWSMFCFATDDFPRLALGLSRFAIKTVVPTLFGEMGAHRLQCDSHEKHVSAHKWLKLLGAEREAIKAGYGRDGANYFSFVIQSKKSTKATTSPII